MSTLDLVTLVVVGAVALGTAGLGAFVRWQGDENIVLETGDVKHLQIADKGDKLKISFEIPLVNMGKQNGMVIDFISRVEYFGPLMERVEAIPLFRARKEPIRKDWYWEAIIVEKKKKYTVEGCVVIRGIDSIAKLREEIPLLKLNVYLKTVGRCAIQYRFFEVKLPLDDTMEEERA